MRLRLPLSLGIQARVLILALGLSLPALMAIGWLSLNRLASARDVALERSAATLLAQAERTLQDRAFDKAELYNRILFDVQRQIQTVQGDAVKAFSTPQSELPAFRPGLIWLAGRGPVANPEQELRLVINQAQIVAESLQSQVESNPLISLGYIALENGTLIFNSEQSQTVLQLPEGFDPRTRSWYIAASEADGPIWAETYVDAVSRELIITTAAPIRVSGRLVGVIGFDVRLNAIQTDVLKLNEDSSGYAFLMDRDGDILVRPDLEVGDTNWDETFRAENLFETDDPALSNVAIRLEAGEGGLARLALGGGDRYLAYAPMESTGWSVGLMLPIEEVIAPAQEAAQTLRVQQQRLRYNLIGLIIAIATGLIFFSLLMARTILKPIRTLDEGAQSIAAGKLDAQLPVRGNDEIARLSSSFNQMTAALRTKINEMETNAQQLAAINSTSNELKRLRSLGAVLEQIPRLLCTQLGFDRAVLYLVKDDLLEVASVAFGPGKDEQEREFISAVREEPIWLHGASIEAGVVRSRQAVIVENPRSNPSILRRKQEVSDSQSYVQAPIVGRDRVLGVISADYYTQQRPVTVQDASLLLNFADMVGLTIENAFSFQNLEDLVTQRTAELRDALDRAQAADRLKSQFLASVSHELRTPLNAIIGFSTVLLDELAPMIDEAQFEDLETINKNGRYLLDLINDILDMARIEAGRFTLTREPTQVRAVVDGAVDLLRSLITTKPITIRIDVDPEMAPMDVDPTRLRQIVINLLSNALKFTERGQIVIRASRRILDEPTPLGSHLLKPGDWIIMSVQDTGIGMDQDALNNLFQEFRQVHAGARGIIGSGLGLSITRRLIDLHHGELWVDSKPGVGTTFSFAIATAAVEAADPVAADQP